MFEIGHILLSLLTLLFLEIVLGVDNLVFIAIASQKLPADQRPRARMIGLSLALITRLMLLGFISYLSGLTEPLFTIQATAISIRDILMTAGGVFLIYKSTAEIHAEFQPEHSESTTTQSKFIQVIIQIVVLDLIFSLDSIMTAIGMVQEFYLMVIAIILAMGIMIFANTPLSRFIETHPSVKMLAVSFILMVGMVLIADGFHFHVPRPYVYCSILFSLFVETMNILVKRKKETVKN